MSDFNALSANPYAARLARPLEAKRVKQRSAGGNRPALSYLETHDVIRAANEIFGFGGWGHEIVELRQIPATQVNRDGKTGICVGYVCTVRLTVAGCVPTSGIGYGDATEYQASAAVTAHELAAKEAESDALKRALKNYGDQFGLALYDKAAATSGHVVRESAPPAAEATWNLAANKAAFASAAGPVTDEQLDALYALVKQKGGGVAATMEQAETAKNDGRLHAWYREADAYWKKQKDSVANMVPASARAAA